jgi:hypothetical protein
MCTHPEHQLKKTLRLDTATCGACGDTIPCPHPDSEIRGPMGMGKPGAICGICTAPMECPHPQHARIQRRPLGGPVGEAKCGWCGERVP